MLQEAIAVLKEFNLNDIMKPNAKKSSCNLSKERKNCAKYFRYFDKD